MALVDDPRSKGGGDNIVSRCNIISSSSGKQLKELSSRPWHAIVFTESMGLFKGHTQFLSGEIMLLDTIDAANELQFNVNDRVELRFKTPQKKAIDFIGKVYQLGMTDFENKRVLALKFCSEEKLESDQTKFNGAFRDKFYSQMATELFVPLSKIGNKKIWAEPTKNKSSYVINNKSPLDAINAIKKSAKSARYQGANYVFYERATMIAVKFACHNSLALGFVYVNVDA